MTDELPDQNVTPEPVSRPEAPIAPNSSFTEGELAQMEPITQRIVRFWNDRTDAQRDSLSPALLSLASSLMILKGNTAVKLGGASLLGIGLNWIAHNVTHKEGTNESGYSDMLKQVPLVDNPVTLSGLLGLASCAFLGGNAVKNLLTGGKLDANALLVFANFGPWLATNLSSFLTGLKSSGDKIIRDMPDIEVGSVTPPPERAAFGITATTDAKLGMMGSMSVLGFGLSKGYTDTIVGGAAMVAADFLRLFRVDPNVRKGTAEALNDVERFAMKEVPHAVHCMLQGIGLLPKQPALGLQT